MVCALFFAEAATGSIHEGLVEEDGTGFEDKEADDRKRAPSFRARS